VYCTFSKILDDFFALSYALFAVRLQIYTCSRPFRSSMSYVASRALSIPKTTYRETTSFILSHFSQFKYRCYYPIRQKFSWETNSCSANRKIPHIYKTTVLYCIHSARIPFLYSASRVQSSFSNLATSAYSEVQNWLNHPFLRFSSFSHTSSSCSGRIRFDSCSLYPQNEIGPSISSSVVLCAFVLLVDIVVLV